MRPKRGFEPDDISSNHQLSRPQRTVTRADEFDRVFTELFEREFPWLFRYVGRLSGDSDLAADFAQDAFVRLYKRGNVPADARAWLATVATNLYRDSVRNADKRALLARKYNADLIPAAPMPADVALEQSEQKFAVRSALSTLPIRDRQLLLLRHAGFSYGEIATQVGVAPTSVGTLIIRASAAFVAACEGALVINA